MNILLRGARSRRKENSLLPSRIIHPLCACANRRLPLTEESARGQLFLLPAVSDQRSRAATAIQTDLVFAQNKLDEVSTSEL